MRAFVLHRQPYRDSSWLLKLLTDSLGVCSVVARGARALKKREATQPLQVFTPLWVQLGGQGDLKNLQKAEANGPAFTLPPGMAWLSGMYLNELLLRCLPHGEGCQHIFAAYETAITECCANDPLAWTLRLFEKRLLDQLGYAIPLSGDIPNHQPFEPAQWYVYERDRGFRRLPQMAHLDFRPGYCRGISLISLAEEKLYDHNALPELKALLREILAPLIGPKPLQTLELARAWQCPTAAEHN